MMTLPRSYSLVPKYNLGTREVASLFMNSEAVVKALHVEILSLASNKLGRELTASEQKFVQSRGGFIALETILDTVRSGTAVEVERYLNSDD